MIALFLIVALLVANSTQAQINNLTLVVNDLSHKIKDITNSLQTWENYLSIQINKSQMNQQPNPTNQLPQQLPPQQQQLPNLNSTTDPAQTASQGWAKGFVRNAPIPLLTWYQHGNQILKSAEWYTNNTDPEHNYHIKGLIVNTVGGADRVGVSLEVYDRVTGTALARGGGSFDYSPSDGIADNAIISYDLNTNMNSTLDLNRFKNMDGTFG